MQVQIITPDSSIFDGEASVVNVPGIDGTLGILNDHAPLVTVLKKGTVEVKTDTEEKNFEVNGGVVEVLKNQVIILAE